MILFFQLGVYFYKKLCDVQSLHYEFSKYESSFYHEIDLDKCLKIFTNIEWLSICFSDFSEKLKFIATFGNLNIRSNKIKRSKDEFHSNCLPRVQIIPSTLFRNSFHSLKKFQENFLLKTYYDNKLQFVTENVKFYVDPHKIYFNHVNISFLFTTVIILRRVPTNSKILTHLNCFLMIFQKKLTMSILCNFRKKKIRKQECMLHEYE